MEFIGDIEVCKRLVDKRTEYISNCFFLSGQMKNLIENKKLYYQKMGNNFLILCKELLFYRVYYFIKNPEQLYALKLNMPAVIEFPFRYDLSESQKKQIQMIEKMGFHLERESIRMSLGAKEIDCGRTVSDFLGLEVRVAALEDAQEICGLFNEKFNELFAFLPSEDELRENIKRRWVIAAYYKGEMVGAINFTIKGNVAEGDQVAVKYVGNGIGWPLMNKWHELYGDKVKLFRLWMDSLNKRAISMYERAGYKYDGNRSNEYVYRP